LRVTLGGVRVTLVQIVDNVMLCYCQQFGPTCLSNKASNYLVKTPASVEDGGSAARVTFWAPATGLVILTRGYGVNPRNARPCVLLTSYSAHNLEVLIIPVLNLAESTGAAATSLEIS
jgi:hypothetical protein